MIDTTAARNAYHGLGTPAQLVIHALGVHGGTKHVTDGVEEIYALAVAERGYATRTPGRVYTLTPEGWEVFYAGTQWSRDYYGPGLVQGRTVES